MVTTQKYDNNVMQPPTAITAAASIVAQYIKVKYIYINPDAVYTKLN